MNSSSTGRYDFAPLSSMSKSQVSGGGTINPDRSSGRRRVNGKPKITRDDTMYAKCAVLSDNNRLSVNFINDIIPLMKHKKGAIAELADVKDNPDILNSSLTEYFNNEKLVSYDGIFTVVEYPYKFIQHHCMAMKSKPMNLQSIQEDTSVFLKIHEYVCNENNEESFLDDKKNNEDNQSQTNVITKEDETAFLGALFCFLVVDLQSVHSANTCFNKLLPIKEQYMPDSFLFVVGMQDSGRLLRSVDIEKICRAVAENDGLYFELHYSNSNAPSENISIYKEIVLIQQVISSRIASMLIARDDLVYRHPTMTDSLQLERRRRPSLNKDAIYTTPGSDEAKDSSLSNKGSGASGANFVLRTPFLDQNLMTDSVGSVLSSCLGTEFWPGFEVETQHLQKIGDRLTDLIENIENKEFRNAAPDDPLEFPMSSDSSHTYYKQMLGENEYNEYSINSISSHTNQNMTQGSSYFENDMSQMEGYARYDDISAYFKIMNIPLPDKIESFTSNASLVKRYGGGSDKSSKITTYKNDMKNSRNSLKTAKLRIKLPNKIFNNNGINSPDKDAKVVVTNMTLYSTYDAEQQVDAFLLQYGLEKNDKARQKLVDVSIRTIDDLKSGRLESPSKAAQNTSNILNNSTIDLNTSNESGGGYNSHDELASRSNRFTAPSAADGPLQESGSHFQRKSFISNQSNQQQQQLQPVVLEKKLRRFKIKVKLPNGNVVESILTEGDDYVTATDEICVAHNITSLKLRQKIAEQVNSALVAVIGK